MPEFDFQEIAGNLLQIGIAYLFALPVAWNREQETQSVGLRTFPLVAVAACGYMLLGIQVLSSTDAEARVLYGIIAGMGFIGGGAIIKTQSRVQGTATAASLWNTGAIGTAVAFHRYEIALVLSLISFATFALARPVKSVTAEGNDD